MRREVPDVCGLCLTDDINILNSLCPVPRQRVRLGCRHGGFCCLSGGSPLREREVAVCDPGVQTQECC